MPSMPSTHTKQCEKGHRINDEVRSSAALRADNELRAKTQTRGPKSEPSACRPRSGLHAASSERGVLDAVRHGSRRRKGRAF